MKKPRPGSGRRYTHWAPKLVAGLCAASLFGPTRAAAQQASAGPAPHLIHARFTGLFLDYEYSSGLVFSAAGSELAWVAPSGLTIEAGGELLVALSDVGWATVARAGWKLPIQGEVSTSERSWSQAITPMLGVRYGVFPFPGTSDGYGLRSRGAGPQLAAAYDVLYGGAGLGFTFRVLGAYTQRVYYAELGNGWTYAGHEESRGSVELGLSLGFSYGIAP